MTQQPTQQLVPLDRPDLPGRRRGFGRTDRIVAHDQRPVVLALMRTKKVIVVQVGLHNVVEMAQAEAEKVVQALTLQAPDPGFSVTVGDR